MHKRIQRAMNIRYRCRCFAIPAKTTSRTAEKTNSYLNVQSVIWGNLIFNHILACQWVLTCYLYGFAVKQRQLIVIVMIAMITSIAANACFNKPTCFVWCTTHMQNWRNHELVLYFTCFRGIAVTRHTFGTSRPFLQDYHFQAAS